MALEQKLSLKLSQRLVMTPSLQQAIKLLQMTRMELETVVAQELEGNPVLEELESSSEEEERAAAAEAGEPAERTEAEASRLEELRLPSERGASEAESFEQWISESWNDDGSSGEWEEREAPPIEMPLRPLPRAVMPSSSTLKALSWALMPSS